MTVRGQIAVLIYMMVQAELFGVGVVAMVLLPSWAEHQHIALPAITVVTVLVSAPLAWVISPRLQAGYERRRSARAERAAQPPGKSP